jgi:hypothetical protein
VSVRGCRVRIQNSRDTRDWRTDRRNPRRTYAPPGQDGHLGPICRRAGTRGAAQNDGDRRGTSVGEQASGDHIVGATAAIVFSWTLGDLTSLDQVLESFRNTPRACSSLRPQRTRHRGSTAIQSERRMSLPGQTFRKVHAPADLYAPISSQAQSVPVSLVRGNGDGVQDIQELARECRRRTCLRQIVVASRRMDPLRWR